MSSVRPFCGVRPRPELAAEIAAPPYDVMDFDEAVAYVANRPNSFLRVEKSEIELDKSLHMHDQAIFENGAKNLARMLEMGLMMKDRMPCFYLYRQKMGDHVQTGLVAGASVLEYQSGLIKKHEFTRPDKEEERTRHVDVISAHTGPVFLTYRRDDAIEALFSSMVARTPTVDFVAEDGIGHTLWVISDSVEVASIQSAFEKVPALYIADGHHRAAAASRVQQKRAASDDLRGKDPAYSPPYDYFLTVLFPHDQMKIMEYNRVVADLNGYTVGSLKEAISASFVVAPGDSERPSAPNTFGMYLEGTWYRLTARPGTFDPTHPVNSLDVAILQNNLLGPILGIANPRTDKRIAFVGGIRGTKELERKVNKGGGVAFSMYPTQIEQLMRIADANEVMPPKSTWFEPKLRSGMVVKQLDRE